MLRFAGGVIFVGPDFWMDKVNPLFVENENLFVAWKEHAIQKEGLKIPNKIKQASAEYKKENDIVSLFLQINSDKMV